MRLIDADFLCGLIHEKLKTHNYLGLGEMFLYAVKDLLDTMPTIDAVKVVRCKDCKYRQVNEHYGEEDYLNLKVMCNMDTGDPFELGRNAWDDNWFCADGEEKSDVQKSD